MTVPEWLVVWIFGIFVAVIGWGIQRLVRANDETNQALGSIGTQLATMNGRLGKSEQWQQMHEAKDDERHEEIKGNVKEIWKTIDALRT